MSGRNFCQTVRCAEPPARAPGRHDSLVGASVRERGRCDRSANIREFRPLKAHDSREFLSGVSIRVTRDPQKVSVTAGVRGRRRFAGVVVEPLEILRRIVNVNGRVSSCENFCAHTAHLIQRTFRRHSQDMYECPLSVLCRLVLCGDE